MVKLDTDAQIEYDLKTFECQLADIILIYGVKKRGINNVMNNVYYTNTHLFPARISHNAAPSLELAVVISLGSTGLNMTE